MSHRKTADTMLVRRFLDQWETDGWHIKKILRTKPDDPHRTYEECDSDNRIIRMYPKLIGQGDPPLAKSFLHGCVHAFMGYGGSDKEEKEVGWWENRLWKHMLPEQKERLIKMVEESDE